MRPQVSVHQAALWAAISSASQEDWPLSVRRARCYFAMKSGSQGWHPLQTEFHREAHSFSSRRVCLGTAVSILFMDLHGGKAGPAGGRAQLLEGEDDLFLLLANAAEWNHTARAWRAWSVHFPQRTHVVVKQKQVNLSVSDCLTYMETAYRWNLNHAIGPHGTLANCEKHRNAS